MGPAAITDVLHSGTMTVHGRIPGSSNATLLVTCADEERELLAVYKPARGERPLWDFADGLHRREVAAYELDLVLGWNLVPETVERHDAPFGPGSVQRFVPEDGEAHYFTLREHQEWWPTLKKFAAFDVVANNADRKSGHVLLADDKLWGIDHGLCFHEEPKLRTVIWDFAGEGLPSDVVRDLNELASAGLPEQLGGLLAPEEQDALLARASTLADSAVLPEPAGHGRWPPYPWPLV